MSNRINFVSPFQCVTISVITQLSLLSILACQSYLPNLFWGLEIRKDNLIFGMEIGTETVQSFYPYHLPVNSYTWRRHDVKIFSALLALREPLTNDQQCRAVVLSLLLARISCWNNSRVTGDSSCHDSQVTSLQWDRRCRIRTGLDIYQKHL